MVVLFNKFWSKVSDSFSVILYIENLQSTPCKYRIFQMSRLSFTIHDTISTGMDTLK